MNKLTMRNYYLIKMFGRVQNIIGLNPELFKIILGLSKFWIIWEEGINKIMNLLQTKEVKSTVIKHDEERLWSTLIYYSTYFIDNLVIEALNKGEARLVDQIKTFRKNVNSKKQSDFLSNCEGIIDWAKKPMFFEAEFLTADDSLKQFEDTLNALVQMFAEYSLNKDSQKELNELLDQYIKDQLELTKTLDDYMNKIRFSNTVLYNTYHDERNEHVPTGFHYAAIITVLNKVTQKPIYNADVTFETTEAETGLITKLKKLTHANGQARAKHLAVGTTNITVANEKYNPETYVFYKKQTSERLHITIELQPV